MTKKIFDKCVKEAKALLTGIMNEEGRINDKPFEEEVFFAFQLYINKLNNGIKNE